mgnify:FL=1
MNEFDLLHLKTIAIGSNDLLSERIGFNDLFSERIEWIKFVFMEIITDILLAGNTNSIATVFNDIDFYGFKIVIWSNAISKVMCRFGCEI